MVQWLRNIDIKTVAYVDDFIGLDRHSLICNSRDVILQTLQRLGYFINFKKSSLIPSCEKKFIGYIINTTRVKDKILLSVPKSRITVLKHDIRRALKKGKISARALAKIAGQCISMSKAVLPSKLLLRNIYRLLATRTSWQDILCLDNSTVKDLNWWLEAVSSWNGRAFQTKSQQVVQITTDASGLGFGGTIVGTNLEAQGSWDANMSSMSSNYREITAVLLTLKSFIPVLKGKTVTVFSDNITTVANINFMGSSHRDLSEVASKIWSLAIRNSIEIQAKFLPGKSNVHADFLSRLPQKYEWILHPHIFAYLDRLYGPHTIDRFASMTTSHLPTYNSRYLDPYTFGINALEQRDWDIHNNFVNPPFRLIEQTLNVICRFQAKATVIAPWWPAMTWFQTLRKLAVALPIRLPRPKHICFPVLTETPEPLRNPRWELYAWRIDGARF